MDIVQIIQGAPIDAGAEVWKRFMLPILASARDQPADALALFYSGAIMAAFGSMAADFGHDQAVMVAEHLIETFKKAGTPPVHTRWSSKGDEA